jgi:hypothetical protein
MPVVRTKDRARPWLLCSRRAGLALGAAALLATVAARAQVPATLTGAPIQVTPYALEPGVPDITIPTGTPTTSNTSGTGTGTGSGTSGTGTSSNALNTLLSQSWGASAVNEAEALGVNPSALAATCVVESGCQNVGSSSGSSATGAFQMQSAAFQDGLNTALAANPELASEVVQGSAGMSDPTTEAIAASGYLMQAASTLQSAGISNPTVLDARGYYEFGPNYGAQVAQAQGSALLSSILPSSFLAQNGISQTETVAEWQAGVAAKVGNAATQPVLS